MAAHATAIPGYSTCRHVDPQHIWVCGNRSHCGLWCNYHRHTIGILVISNTLLQFAICLQKTINVVFVPILRIVTIGTETKWLVLLRFNVHSRVFIMIHGMGTALSQTLAWWTSYLVLSSFPPGISPGMVTSPNTGLINPLHIISSMSALWSLVMLAWS